MIETLVHEVEAKWDIFDAYRNWHNISTDVKEHKTFFDAQTLTLPMKTCQTMQANGQTWDYVLC